MEEISLNFTQMFNSIRLCAEPVTFVPALPMTLVGVWLAFSDSSSFTSQYFYVSLPENATDYIPYPNMKSTDMYYNIEACIYNLA